MKLQHKILLILSMVFILSFVVLEYLHFQSEKNGILESVRQEARNIRGILMSTRRVYHKQFLESGIPLNEKTIGFLPAHALSRISEDFMNWSDNQLTFNNVSDRPRNPDNQADPLEMEAIEFYRQNPEASERFVPYESPGGEDYYHFSTPIRIEAYCLKCHGRRENAPPAIRDNYIRAFDYKVGDLRGIMSIKLPTARVNALAWEQFKVSALIHFTSFLILFAVLTWLILRYVTTPLSKLDKGLRRIGSGEYDYSIEGLTGEMSDIAETFDLMATELSQRENELRTQNERRRALNIILNIVQQNFSIEEQLNKILKTLLSTDWLPVLKRGAIFTVDKNSTMLRLVVHQGFNDAIQASCALVPFGKCLCGRAAETGEVIFSDSLDERHEITYDGIEPHGHYCIPIKSADEIFGVIDLSVSAGHRRDRGEEEFLIAVANTISTLLERRRAEEKLNVSECKFRSLFEGSSDAVMLLDDEAFFDCNDATLHVFGCASRDQFIGKHPSEFSPMLQPDGTSSRELAGKRIATAYRNGKNRFEWLHIRLDGTEFPAEVWLTSVEIEDKHVLQAVVRDITERKQAEEALRDREKRYRELYENSPLGYQSLNSDGCFVESNPSLSRMLGYSREEMIGKWFGDFLSDECKETFKKNFPRFKEIGEIHTVPFEMVRKDGSTLLVEIDGKIGHDEKGNFKQTHCVITDVTQRNRMEAELLKTQKLESVGILAGGIAHDFNNLLGTILGNTSYAKSLATPDDEIYTSMQESEKAIYKARDLTKQLLTFSRGGAPVKKVQQIAEIINEAAQFGLRGSNVKLDFFFSSELKAVEIDGGQLSQVINNMVINACHAMPLGGTIKIRVDNKMVGAADHLPIDSGEYIKISIKDNGVGIVQEDIDRIFDPFFTTKQMGSGLGLATSYTIIKNHHGHVDISSVIGKGTTFDIYLPVSSKKSLEEEVEEEVPVTGEGRILIMDDDESIRNFLCKMLKRLGYSAESVCNGNEVIDTYRCAMERGENFDIVILDLTIPGGMGGKEALTELLKIDPEIKAIVSSGYSVGSILSNYKSYGFKGLTEKPYTMATLSQEIHKVLKGK